MSFSKEKSTTRRSQSTWQRWLPVIAGLVLILFFGSIMWSGDEYSNSTIIQKYFEVAPSKNNNPTVVDATPITNVNYIENQNLAAQTHYRNNDFTKAILAYDVVLENKKNTVYKLSEINFEAAQWNRMLMLLGSGNRSAVLEELKKIETSDISKKYKTNAIELKNTINSFWYGWAN